MMDPVPASICINYCTCWLLHCVGINNTVSEKIILIKIQGRWPSLSMFFIILQDTFVYSSTFKLFFFFLNHYRAPFYAFYLLVKEEKKIITFFLQFAPVLLVVLPPCFYYEDNFYIKRSRYMMMLCVCSKNTILDFQTSNFFLNHRFLSSFSSAFTLLCPDKYYRRVPLACLIDNLLCIHNVCFSYKRSFSGYSRMKDVISISLKLLLCWPLDHWVKSIKLIKLKKNWKTQIQKNVETGNHYHIFPFGYFHALFSNFKFYWLKPAF